jgi:hypothetical protein
VPEEEEGQEGHRGGEVQEEEKEEVGRRATRWGVFAVALAILVPAAAPAQTAPEGAIPSTVITLDSGRLWGTPWEVIAYKNEDGLWCETLLREGTSITCVGTQPAPRPIQVTAAFHRRGTNPTTIAVIGTSEDVARVRLKLVPGHQPLSHRVRPLKEKPRRRAGLPRGFRFFVVALEKVRGVVAIDAFDKSGRLVGHDEGIPAPDDPRR